MKKTSALIAAFLSVSLIGLFIGGCSKEPEIPEVVRVGVLFPLSGELAAVGRDNANGVVLAVEQINRRGGIVSLKGAKLEIVYGDTKGNSEIGIREAERLINTEKVAAIIGVYNSSVARSVAQVAERLETPFIISTGIANDITEQGFRYTFRIIPKADFYGRDQVRFLSDLEKIADYPVKRVALLHENTAFGTSTALAQKRALKEYGLELAIEVSYKSEGATDLSSQVARVLESKPDAILEVTYLNDSILIAKAMANAGSRLPLIDTAGGAISPEYIQVLGPLAEGVFSVSEHSKFAASGKKLNNQFRARFNADFTGDSALCYQSGLVLRDALERAKSIDRKILRDAIAAVDLPSGPNMILPASRLRFDDSGQNKFASLFVVQLQDGQLVPVWPTEFASSKVRINK